MAEKTVTTKKEQALTFKGKPLVRNGNTIYYGFMSDPYVAMLQILSTDADLRPKERIKKRTEKNSLYDAINIASIWLERTLESN